MVVTADRFRLAAPSHLARIFSHSGTALVTVRWSLIILIQQARKMHLFADW